MIDFMEEIKGLYMEYQEMVDALSINENVEKVCREFYEKIRKQLPDNIYKYTTLQLL